VFLPLVLSLAAWQDRRAAEKAVLEARLAAQGAQPAQRLEAWLSQPTEAWALAPTFVQGHWQAHRALWLDNQTAGGRAGYGLYVPLALGDGSWVLVDLGFRPAPARRSELPALNLPSGPVAVSGHLRPAPPVSWPTLRLVFGPEVTLREALLVASPEVEGVEVYQGLTPPMSAAQHRGYRLQWLGLALVLVLGWIFASLERTPQREHGP
jgi:surfeit locus 1 family protein